MQPSTHSGTFSLTFYTLLNYNLVFTDQLLLYSFMEIALEHYFLLLPRKTELYMF